MRKTLTCEELANAMLTKPTVVAPPLPYLSPDDNTFAVTALRQHMIDLASEVAAAEARFGEATVARVAGVTPEFMREMAEGNTTAQSRLRTQPFHAEQPLRAHAAVAATADRRERAAYHFRTCLEG